MEDFKRTLPLEEKKSNFILTAFTFLVFASVYMLMRFSFRVVLSPMSEDLSLAQNIVNSSDTWFLIGYALMQIIGGQIVGKWGIKATAALALISGSLSSLLSVSRNIYLINIIRGLLGMTFGTSILGYFSYGNNKLDKSYFNLYGGIGISTIFASAIFFTSLIESLIKNNKLSWRSLYFIFGGISFLCGIILMFSDKENRTEEIPSFREGLKSFSSDNKLLLLSLSSFLLGFVSQPYCDAWFNILSNSFNLKVSIGTLVTSGFLVGTISSIFILNSLGVINSLLIYSLLQFIATAIIGFYSPSSNSLLIAPLLVGISSISNNFPVNYVASREKYKKNSAFFFGLLNFAGMVGNAIGKGVYQYILSKFSLNPSQPSSLEVIGSSRPLVIVSFLAVVVASIIYFKEECSANNLNS